MKENIKIKRALLETLLGMLLPTRLDLRPGLSRFRRRFLETLGIETDSYNKDRSEVMMAHVLKDKDDKPIWAKDEKGEVIEGHFDFQTLPEKKFKLFDKEFNELANEDFIYEITDANKSMIDTLKLIFIDLDIKFDPKKNEEMCYDIFCEELGIELEDNFEGLVKSLHESLGE